jgi:hypothetical protein
MKEYWRVTQNFNSILHQIEPRKFDNILGGNTSKPYEIPYPFVYSCQQFNRQTMHKCEYTPSIPNYKKNKIKSFHIN